jgi:hypothetical protein
MSTQTLGTLADFIAAHKVTMTCEGRDSNPNMEHDDWHDNAKHYTCVLRKGRKQMTVPFSLGSAHYGDPTVDRVLDCLASDACGFDNANSFEDWAAEYGYDMDSRKAERTFKTVQRQADKLKAFLGINAFDELVYRTERE